VVIEGGNIRRRNQRKKNALLEKIRLKKHSGLVLFSTGTTGKPKAILHDLSLFLKRFETPRPSLVTLNFLLFDHIGGLNTLLHTLFNKGVVIVPPDRTPESILETCSKYKVEVLPATPTFLRIMLLSGLVPEKVPESLKIITYGTEMMDQHTLKELCNLLPKVDFRQTYGMSELGIVRVKSKARDSLYMKIGGEGIQTRVVDNVLQIKSNTRMIGYLNSSSPFGKGGWYDTKDIVQEKEDFIKITGRSSDVVNVGGLKFMTSDVERVALNFPNVRFVKALSRKNPITGEHIEIIVEPKEEKKFKLKDYKLFLKESLEAHMVPRRITVDKISIGHRFKKL
jgi:acyl-CoA synthetase (AMP-forming)/AMP-acid ligase II